MRPESRGPGKLAVGAAFLLIGGMAASKQVRELLAEPLLRRHDIAYPAKGTPRRPAPIAVDPVPRGSRLRFVAGVVLLLVLGLVALRTVRAWLWDEGVYPKGFVFVPLSKASLAWALPSGGAIATILGMLTYQGLPPKSRGGPLPDPHPVDCRWPVVFRVVSRGRNVDALRATVAAIRRQMDALPLFDWSIEVVTDMPVEIEPGPDLRLLVVPSDYRTPAGSLFKARALYYASHERPLNPDTWIFHLDEESQLSPSLVIGIRDAVVEEEANGRHRIGQGTILYGRHLRRHPFMTLADSVRTGDDLGRFHFQHRLLGVTAFGLHGSFLLVRSSVEQQVDFDVGPEGSITEDAFWALRQMAVGNRCRWVDGYLLEQSTQSVGDFVRQRRRWFSGLVRVVLYAESTLPVRILLSLFMAIWSVSWIGMIYTVTNLFLGFRTPPVIAALADISFVTTAVTYVVGLIVMLREHPKLPLWYRAVLYTAQIVLLPVFGILEASGVVLGLVRPEQGFHVVDKSALASASPAAKIPVATASGSS